MSDKRVLLIQENSAEGQQRVELLQNEGYYVVVADSQDLYWPKFIENGQWHAILFDSSSFHMIFVELASELGSAIASRDIPVFLLVAESISPNRLPTSLRQARQVSSDEELLVVLGAEANPQ